jgi:hypothetical protein
LNGGFRYRLLRKLSGATVLQSRLMKRALLEQAEANAVVAGRRAGPEHAHLRQLMGTSLVQ